MSKWKLVKRENAVLVVDQDNNLIADFWPDSAEEYGLPERAEAVKNAQDTIANHNLVGKTGQKRDTWARTRRAMERNGRL